MQASVAILLTTKQVNQPWTQCSYCNIVYQNSIDNHDSMVHSWMQIIEIFNYYIKHSLKTLHAKEMLHG